ncbi:MAG: hypothetical protein NT067_05570 [Candidatus Diapherotrites archaeon]|nr:hypothetical protein [Candidatus Diapherotrites archaeon]
MGNQRGVTPLIAEILLVLVAIGIGSLFMGWIYSYYNDQLSSQKELSDMQIKCDKAGFTIVSCAFDQGDTNVATIQLENTDYVDLNSFTVAVKYNSGNSDINICQVNLEEGSYGNVYVRLDAGESPAEIKVTSRDCKDISDTTTDCS